MRFHRAEERSQLDRTRNIASHPDGQEGGVVPSLLERLGIDPHPLERGNAELLKKLPRAYASGPGLLFARDAEDHGEGRGRIERDEG